jgi:hypothetical protein
MKAFIFCTLTALLAITCMAQSNPKSQATSNTSASAKNGASTSSTVRRVRANLDGFELSAKPPSGTQIGGASRGLGTVTTLLAPHKGKAFGLHPLFQWSNPNHNIKNYTFRLFGPDGKSLLYEEKVSGASFKYPENAPPLQPGQNYFWTVQPSVSMFGEAAPVDEIVIVGAPERDQIQSRLAATSPDSQDRTDVFVDARLWYDAIESCTTRLQIDPSDRYARQLRAELYDQLPQTKPAAIADFEKAK